MRLSKLQKFILLKCFENKNISERKIELFSFYSEKTVNKDKIKIQTALQKSIDNLVEKDLLVAYGHKTAKKWHIEKIKLTSKGKRIIKELINKKQLKLPIK